MTTRLQHVLLHRPSFAADGVTKTERLSADFLLNGASLLRTLNQSSIFHGDLMGCFTAGATEMNSDAAAQLLLIKPSTTGSGRVLIYICPECGDIGCGAYAVRVRRNGTEYMWEDFAFENGYEAPQPIVGVGPFVFDSMGYENAIKAASAL